MQTGCHERWRLRCDSCGGVNKQRNQDQQVIIFVFQRQFGATIRVHHCAYWLKFMLSEASHSEDVQVVRR